MENRQKFSGQNFSKNKSILSVLQIFILKYMAKKIYIRENQFNVLLENVRTILEGRGKPAWKKNAFSPSATLRQDARDKYMSRYLSGADREPEESPSEIYTKDWKLRDDGNLVSGGKRSDRNYIINKDGNYLGNQEYKVHNPSEDDWYGNSSPWREPTYRKTIGKVTPDDIDTLKRVNKEKLIPENNMAKLNEKQIRKVVAECVKRALKEDEITADYQFKLLVQSINSKMSYFDNKQIYPSIAEESLRIAKDLVHSLEEYNEALRYHNPNARALNADGSTNIEFFDKDYRQYS